MRSLLRSLLALCGVLVVYPPSIHGQGPAPRGPVVLITGANRGIGFEFARQYAEQSWTVIATARRPERASGLHELAQRHSNVIVDRLDVTDLEGIAALSKKYREWPIDVLLNNAGVVGSIPAQTLDDMDAAEFHRVMAVNALGPLSVTQAFLDHVARSAQKKVVTITSGSGSLGLAQPGGSAYMPGFIFYRASKAAVNMGMLAVHAQATARGVLVGIYNPGFTQTDMAQEVLDAVGINLVPQPVDVVVTALVARIAELDPERSGKFINRDGSVIPW